MKVKVDMERCQGHGMCNMVCSDVFKYDEDGFVYIPQGMENVSVEIIDAVNLAVTQCPERAISIIQD